MYTYERKQISILNFIALLWFQLTKSFRFFLKNVFQILLRVRDPNDIRQKCQEVALLYLLHV